jgi:catechol 2,3-dioxygenase-like lactoylglutathione lyase family enzyme
MARTMSYMPRLDGVHHLKLPVSDLARSLEWYRTRLGYEKSVEFVEGGTLMGIGMRHSAGRPGLALRLDPDAPRPLPASTTSRSACPTGLPSRSWPIA